MYAIFTGRDGSMGLKTGKRYRIIITTTNDKITVYRSRNGTSYPDGSHGCPYSSIADLNENWMSCK